MVSITHAIEFWLSVWWCVAVRRCEGAKIDVSGGSQQMPPEDQHGGYSHPTTHSCSPDLTASLHTSWTDSMAILTCVEAREQVLLSTSLPTTLHFPPRSGCFAVLGDRAVLWPQVADDPGYRLERPALGVPRRNNQALVEHVIVRWCYRRQHGHFGAFSGAVAKEHQEGQDGDGRGQREQGQHQRINVQFECIHVHA